jgi:hypothetical protein
MKHNGILGIVFIVGCAMGGAAAQLVVPPVRAGSSPTRWEYQCALAEADAAGVTSALNKLGAEGWELVGLVPANATGLNGGFLAHTYTLRTKRALP